ncbi:MAG TPA: radical SAM protein [bacterium]|nr:radical SAM protein [bacterium]
MRICFLQDNGINESLALCDLSAYLRARGHDTQLFLDREESQLLETVRRYDPSIILITANILNSAWTLPMTRRIKQAFPETVLALAGTAATFLTEDLSRQAAADVLVLGEAEYPLDAITTDIEEHGRVRVHDNLWVRDGDDWVRGRFFHRLTDIDALPPSHRRLYFKYEFIRRMPAKRFLSGRGCLHQCAYCFNPVLRSHSDTGPGRPFVRMRRPDTMLAEIDAVRAQSVLRHVHFSDDLFLAFPDWVAQFTDLYRRECRLPFTINSSADLITDDALDRLAAANCRAVCMGVETGDEQTRKRLLHKSISDRQLIEAAERIRRRGMKLVTYNMIALPDETPEQALQTAEMNHRLHADLTHVFFAFPVPKTRMYEEAVQSGHLRADESTLELEKRFVNEPGPAFASSDYEGLHKVGDLFLLVARFGPARQLARRLRKRLPAPLRRIIRVWYMVKAARIFGMPLLSGYLYYRHVGDIGRRTTIYHTLV